MSPRSGEPDPAGNGNSELEHSTANRFVGDLIPRSASRSSTSPRLNVKRPLSQRACCMTELGRQWREYVICFVHCRHVHLQAEASQLMPQSHDRYCTRCGQANLDRSAPEINRSVGRAIARKLNDEDDAQRCDDGNQSNCNKKLTQLAVVSRQFH